ncbi:hypothetical protein LCGC14_1198940 [marine sediment metagenome]|uniref:Uncharacterized protein n=1 Tax=marine sediment metagenome TaxID=412755 RepID=A0A0F9LM22_9ZZZZ
MPKKLHKQLVKSAKKLGLTGKRKAAYVYGTLHKIEKHNPSSSLPDNLPEGGLGDFIGKRR